MTRADKHPLWIALQSALNDGLNKHESGLAGGRIIEIQRQELIDRCLDNVVGKALSLAGARGMTPEQVFNELPRHIASEVRVRFDEQPRKIHKKLEEVQARYRFVTAGARHD